MSRKRKPQSRRITQRPRITESALDAVLNGGAIDADEHLYRPLTGSRGSNLPEFQHERMQAIAKHLYRANPVGGRYISLYVDFVLGEGAQPTFRNAKVEEVVMRHWRDPHNDWERRQTRYFENYLIFGELLVPLFPATGGHMTCGLQLVEHIKAVNTDPENWMIVESVRMKSTTGGDEGRLYNVVNTRENAEGLREVTDPALFWARGNAVGERGMALLYSIADLLDVMDQFVFSEIERAFLLKAFVWDVTFTGGQDQTQIDKMMQTEAFAPPKPGSVRGHNDKVTWQAINPRLDTYDSWNGITKLRTHTGGAMGLPEHWFGSGGDVNRATAAEMDAPTLKRLSAMQREWRTIMVDILQAQIDYAVLAGTLTEMVAVEQDGKATGEMIPARDAVSVELPDLSGSDNKDAVTTLETLGRALALAENEGMVTRETKAKLWLNTALTLGVEIDIPAEIEAARKEADEREAEQQQQFERQMDAQPPTALRALPARRERGEAAGG